MTQLPNNQPELPETNITEPETPQPVEPNPTDAPVAPVEADNAVPEEWRS